jgi:hypothetical protein
MTDIFRLIRAAIKATPHPIEEGRLVVWFSCGAASACALKLLAHRNPVAMYCDTSRGEHSDNMRFMKEVEEWTGVPIQIISSSKYKTIEEVFDARRYMSGVKGAPCTVEMKKVPRFKFQKPDDTHVFGMTTDERKRIAGFEADNHELKLLWPLVDAGMSKPDCLRMVEEAGIRLPMKYLQGYSNNNCHGCVKATSPHYWNLVRNTDPEVFASRCEQSRRLGAKLVRYKGVRIFLDELPPDSEEVVQEDLSCGPQCSPAPISRT